MEHAGRNEVVHGTDGTVSKRHEGGDGPTRAARSAAALAHAAAHGLAVPRVRHVDGAGLVTDAMPGSTSGMALLDRAPDVVLSAIGAFARRLHDLPAPPGVTAHGGGPDVVWVHGDLCPANLLFDDDATLVGVLDWEDTGVDDPLVDLVWTEWLVRTWHPAAVPSLLRLYGAYGRSVPEAADRRRVMAHCIARQVRRTTGAERAEWEQRLAALDRLDLRL